MSSDKQVESRLRLTSPTIYEIISTEGQEELSRPFSSLGWSGLVAGLCISFCLLAEGYLRLHLPEGQNNFLIENIGYTFGFIIVITARLQLFTENTITVILPLLERKIMKNFIRTAKLWAVVFASNLCGTLLVAVLIAFAGFATADQLAVFIEISEHAVIGDPMDIFIRGIPAGFIIATLVWMMPSAKGMEIFVIFLMTYLIAIGDFTHVVAGSCEAFLLALTHHASWGDAITYIGMAGLGNIIGGSALFSVLAYAQVKDEM